MATDPMSPAVLVSVANEIEAAAIVGVLAEHGIRAQALGGYTSGFRAEAPGEVKVVVGRADLARAQQILAEIQSEPGKVDWSKVDFGAPSPPDAQEGLTATEDEPAGRDQDGTWAGALPRFQFSIATLLALQTIVSVVLATWRSLYGRVSFIVVFSATYFLLMAVMPLLIAAGTIGVATDLNRTRQAWRYVGRALTVGIGVLLLFLVMARIAAYLGVGF